MSISSCNNSFCLLKLLIFLSKSFFSYFCFFFKSYISWSCLSLFLSWFLSTILSTWIVLIFLLVYFRNSPITYFLFDSLWVAKSLNNPVSQPLFSHLPSTSWNCFARDSYPGILGSPLTSSAPLVGEGPEPGAFRQPSRR